MATGQGDDYTTGCQLDYNYDLKLDSHLPTKFLLFASLKTL